MRSNATQVGQGQAGKKARTSGLTVPASAQQMHEQMRAAAYEERAAALAQWAKDKGACVPDASSDIPEGVTHAESGAGDAGLVPSELAYGEGHPSGLVSEALSPSPESREPATQRVLHRVRVGYHDDPKGRYHTIVADLSSGLAANLSVHELKAQQKYYIDIPDTKLSGDVDAPPSVPNSDEGGLIDVYYGQYNKSTVRIVATAKPDAKASSETGVGSTAKSIYFRVFAPSKSGPSSQNVSKAKDDKEGSIKPSRVAGDKNSNKILRVALTVDDGPSSTLTGSLADDLGDLRATWYVQRNKFQGAGAKYYDLLKQIQGKGGEIAIHSFHETQNHAFWFPAHGPHANYSFPYAGTSQGEIMRDLASFQNELKARDLRARFVRLPGGLFSELGVYAKEKGIKENDNFARDLIANRDISKYGPAGQQIARDFRVLKDGLNAAGLLLWGGTAKPLDILALSWTGESRGGDDGGKGDILLGGTFRSRVNALADGASTSASFVILTHDTSQRVYLDELLGVSGKKGDLLRMDEYAQDKRVRLEYYTMSQLFELQTEQDPDKIEVNY
ncbi:polysaccharide deacetylase [Haliangium ochraceum DSM 14365]|uniref:Polysaccharide deacetylase n=2 Tax=Haliangium ochraceum TaxID=80816 RepID=D0LFY5_HALO1|nr:polysaccharide deacetylase [Haliangium ochraceum DSM 14365]